jgi:hypothetical protein
MAVKETQEFIELLDVLGNAILEAKEDGKVDWKDAPKILPVLGALRTAVLGADKIVGELKEISDSPALSNLVLNQALTASLKLARAVIV